MIKIPTKTLTTSVLLLSAMAVSSLSAAYVSLDLAAAGNYSASGATTVVPDPIGAPGVPLVISTATTISTSVTIGTTGSFDIEYTLGSLSNGTNSFVNSTGTQYGVGSDTDIAAHYSTLEGNDGEGISFTGLTIDNFVAGDSGLTEFQVSDSLAFSSVTFNNVANNQDGVNISFDSFGDAGATNQNLNAASTEGTPYTYDLTNITGFAAATGVFLENDNTFGSNRWAVEGLQVSYVPEPSSYALLAGLLGLSCVMVCRRKV